MVAANAPVTVDDRSVDDIVAAGPPPHRFEFPNFDYIRLVAATSVIFSHSFTIAQGTEENEPFVRLLGKDNIIGIYGVCVFFVISGFLITMSAAGSRTIVQYAASRILRIFPAFLMCQLVAAVVLGAMFSTSGPIEYLKSLEWARYVYYYSYDIANSWDIPTVVFYRDAAGSGTGVNGSLWTIQQELFCYAVIGLLFLTRTLRWPAIVVICALSFPWLVPWNRNSADTLSALLRWSISDDRIYDYLWVGPSFFIGSLIFFYWRRDQRLPAWPNLIALAIFAVAVWKWRFYDLFPLYFAYPLLYAATATRYTLPSLKRFGDISYGMYLYGWPVQQMIRGLWGPGITWWELLISTVIVAGVLSYASWHLLEKPALSLKRYFRSPRWSLWPFAFGRQARPEVT